MDKLPKVVTERTAEGYRRQMELGSIVFMNEHNAERFKDAMPPELWEEKQKELAKFKEDQALQEKAIHEYARQQAEREANIGRIETAEENQSPEGNGSDVPRSETGSSA